MKKIKELLFGKARVDEVLPPTLEFDKSGSRTGAELHIAVAALLVNIASADEEVNREEAEAICSMIEFNLGVPQEEIPVLVEMAVVARRNKSKSNEFINLINDNFSTEQRIRLLAMVWKIILADKKVEQFEDRMVIKYRNQFRLTEEQSEKSRKLAESDKV